MHHKTWPNAKPGDNVGMNIKGLDKTKMPKVDHQVSCGLVGKLKFKWDFIMVIATIILEARTRTPSTPSSSRPNKVRF